MGNETSNDRIILLSGLPGKMSTLIAESLQSSGCRTYACALTGPNQPNSCVTKGFEYMLFPPESHEEVLEDYTKLATFSKRMVVDFSQQDAVNKNVELYCKHKIPFVMGTSVGSRENFEKLEKMVIESGNMAVIAPNMADPVVFMQAVLEYAAEQYPNALQGLNLTVSESHQAGKKNTSQTARDMISSFNKLGIPFDAEQIKMVRDPIKQAEMGVPIQYRDGHGYHRYVIESKDGTVHLEFVHNINGRVPYVQGTLKAIDFLHERVKYVRHDDREGRKGSVYSMKDVLMG